MMTKEVNAVIDAAFEHGAKEIVVNIPTVVWIIY